MPTLNVETVADGLEGDTVGQKGNRRKGFLRSGNLARYLRIGDLERPIASDDLANPEDSSRACAGTPLGLAGRLRGVRGCQLEHP